jgi:hypothetical protein
LQVLNFFGVKGVRGVNAKCEGLEFRAEGIEMRVAQRMGWQSIGF